MPKPIDKYNACLNQNPSLRPTSSAVLGALILVLDNGIYEESLPLPVRFD